jgi:MOSC domain-containing protein YiiM
MSKVIAKILSLKVGKIDELKNNEKVQKSAIKKTPIKESYLSKLGFIDDEQADKRYHGGENKAVLFFPLDTYKKIETKLNISFEYDNISPLGENLLVSDICEDDICVGDILKIGMARVQVTQPREPCNKLNINTQNKQMLKTILKYGYTGWYAKVLQEGIVNQSDSVELIERIYPNLTISKLNRAMINPKYDEKLTLEALCCEVLGEPFKQALKKAFEIK